MKTNSIIKISILLNLLTAASAWGASQVPDYTIHQEYVSTRALGMGNAFIAVADDFSSMFYNPAALALREDSQLRLFLRGGLDGDILKLNKDIKDAGKDQTALQNAIEKHYGEHMYFRAPTIGGVLVRPNWGIAVLPVDLSVDLALHQSLMPSIFVNAYLDTTIAYSHATTWHVPWLKNRLAFGWTAKMINRAFYSDVLQSAQLAQDQDIVNIDRANEGATLDGDIGFIYNPKRSEKKWYQPGVGVVVRNVFDYGFPKNFGLFNKKGEEPPKLQRRLDIGTKFDLPAFWIFDPKIAIDEKDIFHRNWTLLKGLHIGAEMGWKVANWWKGHWSVGLNQGYMSAGFGGKLGIFQLDLATWGEEVGPSKATHESRRYIAEMSLDF
jgi:hypothetical protein